MKIFRDAILLQSINDRPGRRPAQHTDVFCEFPSHSNLYPLLVNGTNFLKIGKHDPRQIFLILIAFFK